MASRARGSLVADTVRGVQGRLETFLAEQRAQAAQISPRAPELVDAVSDLTLRGGKRLRAVVLHAGYCAATSHLSPAEALDFTLDAGASLELLQTYLLIQDDWMDDDTERRGGPAVHAAFAARSGDARLGASLAILAADLAAGFAWELLGRAPFPAARRLEATATFARMHFEVVSGQQLDLCHHEDVALTHALKTGSYTVRGPLALGALLGNASPRKLAALERFGGPVGMAFQLRDDILGTFGDPAAVGKPVGADLRAGKRTALVAEAQDLLGASDRKPLEAVLGVRDASEGAIHEATHLLESSGARARVEARLDALLADAKNALYDPCIDDRGREMLLDLLSLLLHRDR